MVEKIEGWHEGEGDEPDMYLVKWDGYDAAEDSRTWEPAHHLQCDEAIRKYKEGESKGTKRTRAKHDRRVVADTVRPGDWVKYGDSE